MAIFIRNPYSGKSSSDEYYAYLQNQSYVDDVTRNIRDVNGLQIAVIRQTSENIQTTINNASSEQKSQIQASTNAICSSLDMGFEKLGHHLDNVNNSIDRVNESVEGVAQILGEGFAMIASRLSNIHESLSTIKKLLRIPDSQKQRVYYIEEGMKYLQNAFLYGAGSDFFEDALEEFNKAIAMERKDYISLYRVGRIYYNSTKYCNLPLAESNFKMATKYYLAEASSGGTTTSNYMLQNPSNYSTNFFLKEGAESMLYAAKSCYAQGKTSEAIQLAGEAWNIYPNCIHAGFVQSKYLLSNKEVNKSVDVLEKVIRQERIYAKIAIGDEYMQNENAILIMLDKLRMEAINEAEMKYKLCLNVKTKNSSFESILKQLNHLIQKQSYLDAKYALDLFENPELLGL